ncbi:hypothetical protein [Flavobacterium marginilacus]|nr:hypothetical protein [Flavobacterium marginilacus]
MQNFFKSTLKDFELNENNLGCINVTLLSSVQLLLIIKGCKIL